MSRVARENLWNEVISHEVASYANGVRRHLAKAARAEKVAARVRREGEDRSRHGVARLCYHHTAPDRRPRTVPACDLDCRVGCAANRRREITSDVELYSTSRLIVKGREAHDGVVQPATKG